MTTLLGFAGQHLGREDINSLTFVSNGRRGALIASVVGSTSVVGSDGPAAVGSKANTISIDWINFARSISSQYSSSAEAKISSRVDLRVSRVMPS